MKLFKTTMSRVEIIDRAEVFIFTGFILGVLAGFTIGIFC